MGSGEAPDGRDGPTDDQLARMVVRGLAALVTLTLAGGVASAAGRLADRPSGIEGAGDAVVGAGALSPRGGIGPLPGTAVAAYERARAAALADVPSGERRAAVISFAGYRTVDAALEAVAGLRAEALLVALPGGRPVQVPTTTDLVAVASGARREAAAEKKALEELLPTVTDQDFRRQYQDDIERLTAFLAAPSDAGVGPVVHAVLVVGTGDALRRTARVAGVRLVDPGADAPVPGIGAAAALRPEETDRAGDPPVRPR
ncbi:MAG TPA: hypothetical protein VM933_06625 [Acidimicrobiales bacterium]|nr:hypothetical protein [Acidimicrobiales bacterium]